MTKPAVGLFDFANNITEGKLFLSDNSSILYYTNSHSLHPGIRNTTTVFDQSSIDRVRLPRFTASDGILRPYQEREALGQVSCYDQYTRSMANSLCWFY